MTTVGVVIGRFQIDVPHEGHMALIQQVQKRHQKVLICLGCAPVRLTRTDPLDFPTRARMMQKHFPEATIVPLHDQQTDEAWSKNLDRMISEIFPTDSALLYGSRKSFAKHYHGRWPVWELPEVKAPSGTELRELIASTVRDSPDFRAGVIYASANRFVHSYPVVDVAVLRYRGGLSGEPEEKFEVLLCKKEHSLLGEWGFIGGFFGSPDQSYEDTAKREIKEEVGIDITGIQYVGSTPIDDWRYRGRGDCIVSTFFRATYSSGTIKAEDDIVDAQWFPISALPNILWKSHQILGQKLIQHLKERR